MISAIPSARKPNADWFLIGSGSVRSLGFLACVRRIFKRRGTPLLLVLVGWLALAGCARDPLEEAAWQASRVGTAVGDHREITQITGLEAGARIAERYYFVAQYQATQEQRRLAENAARRIERPVRSKARSTPATPPTRTGSSPKPAADRPRYLAVRTKSDARATTPVSVMIFDTETQEIVGNNVYDINSTPPRGASVTFETFTAEFVGGG